MLATIAEIRGNVDDTNMAESTYSDTLIVEKCEAVQAFLGDICGVPFEPAPFSVSFPHAINTRAPWWLEVPEIISIDAVNKDGEAQDITGVRLVDGHGVHMPNGFSGGSYWQIDGTHGFHKPGDVAQAKECVVFITRMWVRQESDKDGPNVIQMSEDGMVVNVERPTITFRTGSRRIDSILFNLYRRRIG